MRRLLLSLVLPLIAAACSPGLNPMQMAMPDLGDPGNANFLVRESVGQLMITHADPNTPLAVFDSTGAMVQSGTSDKLGSLIFRLLTPGSGYVIKTTAATPEQYSRQLTVMSVTGSLPAQDFYSTQTLVPGYNYIKTRDGTTLSAFVAFPGPVDGGPYFTVVDYSGYNPSQPAAPYQQYEFLCNTYPVLCNPPSDISGVLAAMSGYASVSVNIRGTGCSGGAYDFFETLELLDGYDVMETVAAQSWVAGHKVAMAGLSYPGIAELFVGKARPPSLAAIAPMSVIGNVATTLLPGGILNNGFALEWVTEVVDGADPYGQGWEQGMVNMGDTVCEENQLLHGQKVNNVAEAENTPFYVPALEDPLNPTFFANQIDIPVFLAGGFQDEQTGPFFITLLDQFKGSPMARFTTYNGLHPDGYAPQVYVEWKAFLDLFLAQQKPTIAPIFRSLAPQLFNSVYHSMLALPPDRFAQYTGYDDALAAYMKEPPVRVIFEDGSGSNGSDLGAPQGAFDMKFSQWPPVESVLNRFYFHADGSLSLTAPVETSASSSFLLDPDAGQRLNIMAGADPWQLLPAWNWIALIPTKAIAFVTDVLTSDSMFLGTSSADLWLKSTADDADLQVTISEVRPDGQEMFVQSGWLRASYRTDGPDSTPLWPSQTLYQSDLAPLVPGQWVQARVAIPGAGHVFRKGSRIRVSVDTPGGTRSEWQFQLKTFPGPVTHTIGHDSTHASSIAVALIPNYTATTPLPACPSLRGQPCRAYVPLTNTPGM